MKKYIIIYKHSDNYCREGGYLAMSNDDKSLQLFTLEEAKQIIFFEKKLAEKKDIKMIKI